MLWQARPRRLVPVGPGNWGRRGRIRLSPWAASTLRCYARDWAHFTAWCGATDFVSLPTESKAVALYIADLAENHKPSTIQRRLSAISHAHQIRGFESPTKNEAVRSVLKGIRRTPGTAPAGKAPLLAADIREMVAGLPDSLLGCRDRALLLLGFAGAFRRSELVGLKRRRHHVHRRRNGDSAASIEDRPGRPGAKGWHPPVAALAELPGCCDSGMAGDLRDQLRIVVPARCPRRPDDTETPIRRVGCEDREAQVDRGKGYQQVRRS